jgi:hypothetical protein
VGGMLLLLQELLQLVRYELELNGISIASAPGLLTPTSFGSFYLSNFSLCQSRDF